MTYAELKARLDAFTPDQLAMKALWSGDMRGGEIRSIDVLEEDHINPSGDGWEPVSMYAKERAAEQDVSIEEAERLTRDDEEVVGIKGQPLLVVD